MAKDLENSSQGGKMKNPFVKKKPPRKEKIIHHHLHFIPPIYPKEEESNPRFQYASDHPSFEHLYKYLEKEKNPTITRLFSREKLKKQTPKTKIEYKRHTDSDMNNNLLTTLISLDVNKKNSPNKLIIKKNTLQLLVFYYEDPDNIQKYNKHISFWHAYLKIYANLVDELKNLTELSIENFNFSFSREKQKIFCEFNLDLNLPYTPNPNLPEEIAKDFKSKPLLEQMKIILFYEIIECEKKIKSLSKKSNSIAHQQKTLAELSASFPSSIIVVTDHTLWNDHKEKELLDLAATEAKLKIIPIVNQQEIHSSTSTELDHHSSYAPHHLILQYIELNTKIHDYIGEREKEPREYLHLFHCGGFSRTEKLHAANILRDIINGKLDKNILTPGILKVLNQGRLSKTYKLWIEYQQTVAAAFLGIENPHLSVKNQ